MSLSPTPEQSARCESANTAPDAVDPEERVGIALQTLGQVPLHGLRHPRGEGVSGWFLWCGEYSEDPNFFQPLCAKHLPERCPDAVEFLALPPGWRFFLGPGHEDVWFDPELLDVSWPAPQQRASAVAALWSRFRRLLR